MINPQALAIAETRRARELHMLGAERDRVNRRIADDVIGQSGQQRQAGQTAELQKRVAELDGQAARLTALSPDELVNQYVPEAA